MNKIIKIIYWRLLLVIRRLFNKRPSPPEYTHLSNLHWAEIGPNTYDNGVIVWRFSSEDKIKVGKYCSIAKDVVFLCGAGGHDLNNVTTSPLLSRLFDQNDMIRIGSIEHSRKHWEREFNYTNGPIVLENDVWVGYRAIIQSGVTISNGAVVLANSVVTKDVPPYAVVGGVPAQVVKYRFDQKTIEKLLSIAWWDWNEDYIKQNISDFYIPVSDFILKH